MLGDGRRVGGVMVHVVARIDLGRTAVAAAVVRHHPIAVLEEEQHLGVPIVAAERPAVMKHDGLGRLRTPVLVEDFHAVGGLDEAAAHFLISFRCWLGRLGLGKPFRGEQSPRRQAGGSGENLAPVEAERHAGHDRSPGLASVDIELALPVRPDELTRMAFSLQETQQISHDTIAHDIYSAIKSFCAIIPMDETPPLERPAMRRAKRAPKDNDVLRLASFLCFAIYSTGHAFNRVYKPLLDALGLTYPQYLAMVVLWEKDDQTVGSLGDKLFLEFEHSHAVAEAARGAGPRPPRPRSRRRTSGAGVFDRKRPCASGKGANHPGLHPHRIRPRSRRARPAASRNRRFAKRSRTLRPALKAAYPVRRTGRPRRPIGCSSSSRPCSPPKQAFATLKLALLCRLRCARSRTGSASRSTVRLHRLHGQAHSQRARSRRSLWRARASRRREAPY